MEMRKFDFNGVVINVIVQDGEPRFIAKDVCDVLNLQTRDVPKVLDSDEISYVDRIHLGLRSGKPMIIINESGLYSLVFKSRKPEAKAFKKWVTGTVLPAIRQTGGYVKGEEHCESEEELYLRTVTMLKAKLDQKRQLLEENVSVDRWRTLYLKDYLPHGISVALGKRATAICMKNGWPITNEPRTIYTKDKIRDGVVNCYPKRALDMAWAYERHIRSIL